MEGAARGIIRQQTAQSGGVIYLTLRAFVVRTYACAEEPRQELGGNADHSGPRGPDQSIFH